MENILEVYNVIEANRILNEGYYKLHSTHITTGNTIYYILVLK